MKNITDFLNTLQQILNKDSRYKLEAYSFLMSALNYTVGKLDKPRHITAKELLYGIREYGLDQFGPMAGIVLEHWRVKSTQDFGNIVFNLIELGLLSKTNKDKITDFRNVYNFKEVFDKNYRYNLTEDVT